MQFVEFTAVFSSPEQTEDALERVRSSVANARTYVSAQCTVHVIVPKTAAEAISRTLRESGALDLAESEPPPSPGWMSHQDGRVTGTGVEPGAGDSEAGAS